MTFVLRQGDIGEATCPCRRRGLERVFDGGSEKAGDGGHRVGLAAGNGDNAVRQDADGGHHVL